MLNQTRFRHKQRGQIIAVIPIALLAFIGTIGLVVDVGLFKLVRSEMQSAADAAALAAVWYDPICPASDTRCAPDNTPSTPSNNVAAGVASDFARDRYNGQVVKILCGSQPTVSPQFGTINQPKGNALTVVIKCQAGWFGASLFGISPIQIWVTSTAVLGNRDPAKPGTHSIIDWAQSGTLGARLVP